MRTRLITVSLLATLWAGAAQASVVANVVGAVVGVAVSSAVAKKNKSKIGSCTLYDRAGNPVTVSCPADVAAANVDASADFAGGPPPQPAPYSDPAYGPGYDQGRPEPPPQFADDRAVSGASQAVYLSGGLPEARCISCVAEPPPVHYAPPVAHYAPPPVYAEPDCGCEPSAHHRAQYRDDSVHRPRSVASFLSAGGGHSEVRYSAPRLVGSYESYEESSEQVSGYYEESSSYGGSYGAAYGGGFSGGVEGAYGYGGGFSGFDGGVGQGIGFNPYGGGGYGAGGYNTRYPARVAGRDAYGFLTWPGKR